MLNVGETASAAYTRISLHSPTAMLHEQVMTAILYDIDVVLLLHWNHHHNLRHHLTRVACHDGMRGSKLPVASSYNRVDLMNRDTALPAWRELPVAHRRQL